MGMRNVTPGRSRPHVRRYDVHVDYWTWLYDDPYHQMTATDPRQDDLDARAADEEAAERLDEYADRDLRPAPRPAKERVK